MKNLILWVAVYAAIVASSQIFLKLGVNQTGAIQLKNALAAIRNPYVIVGTLLMTSSFFVWISILSMFKLGLAFPLTAMVYVFVAGLAYLVLGERLMLHNYAGILLIAAGIFFLLYKL